MILNKNNLVENILNELSDNSTGQISPYDIRHNLLDIIDSVHLLTGNSNLNALNFATPETRTTKAGNLTLEKLNLDGYNSVDNTAFGYSALKCNYQGAKNTAVGSFALSCNLFGEDNVGLGFHSLGGNTTGFGNLGLGNFSLNNNKIGNFNVAIGHGAGYYVTRDTNYKLFIAAHAVNEDYICDNPLGSGLTPLVYGDLSNLRFGIATRSLHDYGVLQVSGNITPSQNNEYYLGHPSYQFHSLYLSNSISLGSNSKLESSQGGLTSSGDISPAQNKSYNLGSSSSTWLEGHFENIYVSGEARINKYTTIENCEYVNKTIYLAASGSIDSVDGGGPYGLLDYYTDEGQTGHPCGYLDDNDLVDAGFIIKSSGNGYARDYKFTFLPPDNSLNCLEADTPYSRASWNSNISLHLASGTHLKTDRITSYGDLNIVSPSSCYGVNINNDERIYISKTNILYPNPASTSGHLAGIGNVNFISNSGSTSNYFVAFSALESGVTVGHRFLTGTKKRVKDNLNNSKDKLSGFELKYIDDTLANITGPLSDRFVIGSYNNSSTMVNALTIMKDNGAGNGLVGITNINPGSDNVIPNTILNIRSTGDAVTRITADNNGNTKAAIQLLGGANCEQDGLEFAYFNASGLADISMYKDSGKVPFVRLYENNKIGLFTGSGLANDMLTLGDRVFPNAVVSLHVSSGNPVAYINYSKLFIKQKFQPYQANSVYLLDSSGNIQDLVVNKFDVSDGRAICGDSNNNTFGGVLCPSGRHNLPSAYNNTAIGFKSLYALTTGDNNTVIGSSAGSGLTTGSNNIIIGYNTAPNIRTDNNNILIGNNLENSASGSYNFVLGSDNGNILLIGKSGPSNADKHLTMPSGGQLIINNIDNSEAIRFRNNNIDVIDRGGSNYPENALSFNFTGNNTSTLALLDHNCSPMSNSPTYQLPLVKRPSFQLNGDLKLRGAIRFSNNTSLDSASFLNNITVLESGMLNANSGINSINNRLNSFVVEGYVPSGIAAPINHGTQTSGIFILKDANWNDTQSVFLCNKDSSSRIQAGSYVIAVHVNGQYRPIWISSTTCECCPSPQ